MSGKSVCLSLLDRGVHTGDAQMHHRLLVLLKFSSLCNCFCCFFLPLRFKDLFIVTSGSSVHDT